MAADSAATMMPASRPTADAAATMMPMSRAVGGSFTGAGGSAAAPATALSDSNPGAAETFISPRPVNSTSASDSDATVITNSPFPGAGAATSMAASAPRQAATAPSSASWLPDFGQRYQVISLLGQGGMGAVYKARDLELDRIVALKLLRPELIPDAGAIQRFKQELLLASKVSHRNILRIHDLGDANGVKFISMAYIEGEDLHHVIQDNGRLPVPRALHFARQMLAALEAAHSEGVIHRDLKPQNMMVDANDQLYVMDFGLAKSVETDAHMTMTGQVVGTPQYMAPEQVEGGPLDHRADIYAFGLILDEMLTGELVFKADSAFHLMLARIREAPRSPRTVVPDLPEYLERIVMRCLMRAPEERYQSAREVLDDISAQTAGEVRAQQTLVLSAVGSRPAVATAKPKGLRVAVASLVAVVAIAAASMAVPGIRHRIFPVKQETRRIAVLPLKVAGDTANFGYIADGITEALAAELGDLNTMQVASATAVQKLPANVTPQQAASNLGVSYVVSGTLTTGSNDELSVVLTLYGNDGQSSTIQKKGVKNDLIAVENDLFRNLINSPALAVKASDAELVRTASHTSANANAEDLYLRGKNLLSGQFDETKLRSAFDEFDQASKADPNFALAYTGIADASLRLYKLTKDQAWASKAQSASQAAANLDAGAQLPEVHFALGSVYTATGRANEAIAELNRAVQLAPNSDDGYRRLGDAYRAVGNYDQAVTAYQKAINLNPYYWFNYNVLGTALLRSGKNQQAVEKFNKVLSLNPDNQAAYRNLCVAYFQLGNFEQAAAVAEKAVKLKPDAIGYSNLGTAHFYLKRYDEAVQNFQAAVKLDASETNLGNLADAYRWSEHKNEAAKTYEAAIAAAQKALRVNAADAAAVSRMGTYLAKNGDSIHGLENARRATQLDPKSVEVAYNLAVVEAIAGKDDDALTTLAQALKMGYSALQARNDPEFASLQSCPDFTKLVSPSAAQ